MTNSICPNIFPKRPDRPFGPNPGHGLYKNRRRTRVRASAGQRKHTPNRWSARMRRLARVHPAQGGGAPEGSGVRFAAPTKLLLPGAKARIGDSAADPDFLASAPVSEARTAAALRSDLGASVVSLRPTVHIPLHLRFAAPRDAQWRRPCFGRAGRQHHKLRTRRPDATRMRPFGPTPPSESPALRGTLPQTFTRGHSGRPRGRPRSKLRISTVAMCPRAQGGVARPRKHPAMSGSGGRWSSMVGKRHGRPVHGRASSASDFPARGSGLEDQFPAGASTNGPKHRSPATSGRGCGRRHVGDRERWPQRLGPRRFFPVRTWSSCLGQPQPSMKPMERQTAPKSSASRFP